MWKYKWKFLRLVVISLHVTISILERSSVESKTLDQFVINKIEPRVVRSKRRDSIGYAAGEIILMNLVHSIFFPMFQIGLHAPRKLCAHWFSCNIYFFHSSSFILDHKSVRSDWQNSPGKCVHDIGIFATVRTYPCTSWEVIRNYLGII